MRVLRVLDNELKVKVSPSWLDKAACPAALKYEYIDKHKRDFSVAAERGSAAHAAIADLTRIALKRECQPQDLEDELVTTAVSENTDHRLYEELPNIHEWVTKWRNRYKLSKHMVGHEEKLAIDEDFEECDWSDAAYRGITDVIVINGTHCIVDDYKSQPYVLSQTDLDAHYQLTFYCWLVSKFYPFVKTFEVRIWYLRYGFSAGTPRTWQQLKEFEAGLMLKVDKVMSIDNWDPIPGAYCKWCDHTGRCPVGQPDKEGVFPVIPEAIINAEQAQKYGSQLRVIEERSDKIKKALRAYVKGHEEPVRLTSDFVYGYRPSKSLFFPPEKVLETLKEHGVDPSGYATFSATAMKKLLKSSERDQPALFHDLENIADHTVKTQFKGYKP